MTEARDLSVPSVLLLNVETSGLYRDDLTPFDPGQPWAMSVAAMLCNEGGVVTQMMSHIIKADGRTAKENAVKVHGIPARITAQIGVPEPRVLGMLADMLKTAIPTAMKVVTYGDLDRRIITSLFSRFGESQGKPNGYDRLWAARPGTEFVNLMTPWCQQACKLKSEFESGEYRWPTLDEAAQTLLGRAPREGFHDSFQDLLILKDLYLELALRGLFNREAAAA